MQQRIQSACTRLGAKADGDLLACSTALVSQWEVASRHKLIEFSHNGSNVTFTAMGMMEKKSREEQLAAANKHDATVIFSHGLGDTGHGWSDGFRQISRLMPSVKFIFPTARNLPVTLNMGMRMPAWYDIKNLDERLKDEAEGIEDSAAFIQALAVREAAKLEDPSRVVIGGFSQGGALSLYAAHTYEKPIAGVMALSAYVTARAALDSSFVGSSASAPLFMGHGTHDGVVPHSLAEESFAWIKAKREAGSAEQKSRFTSYPGLEHSSSNEEMRDVLDFLQNVLGTKKPSSKL